MGRDRHFAPRSGKQSSVDYDLVIECVVWPGTNPDYDGGIELEEAAQQRSLRQSIAT